MSQGLPCPNPAMNSCANISCMRSAFWGKADTHWLMSVSGEKLSISLSIRSCSRSMTARAVQRSLHDPQREHGIDPSDSDAIAPVAHVVHVVVAEDIGGEGSQASEDAGVAADPTVVLAEADIADMVQPVLDPPMATDGVSAGCGGQGNVGNEVGDLAGSLPQAGCGDALERVAGDG